MWTHHVLNAEHKLLAVRSENTRRDTESICTVEHKTEKKGKIGIKNYIIKKRKVT